MLLALSCSTSVNILGEATNPFGQSVIHDLTFRVCVIKLWEGGYGDEREGGVRFADYAIGFGVGLGLVGVMM